MSKFHEALWQAYAAHGRSDLPWRKLPPNPYHILVSEIMLQQTQVPRVLPKFNEFLMKFPSLEALAAAALADVLRAWNGLGYNRRAKYLWEAAQMCNGQLPTTHEQLVMMPGVGPNTAGAIMAYAYNQPSIFIETNVRTVYLNWFFPGQSDVPDSAIRSLLEQTLDHERPRDFYWALMDWGTVLKQSENASRRSKHYTKQSKFEGSRRQLRGLVLRQLAAGSQPFSDDGRLAGVLEDLAREGLISQTAAGDWSL